MRLGRLNILDIGRSQNVGTLSIKLDGMRELRFRSWLGRQIIRLGVWVLPFKIDVEYD